MLDRIRIHLRATRLARRVPLFLAALALGVGLGGAARAESGYLGVHLQELDATLAAALDLESVDGGVLVTKVVEGSPAEEAGLQQGDVILSFDGAALRSTRSLTRKVARGEPGEKIALEIVRKGDRRTVEVTLGEREEDEFTWFGEGRNPPRVEAFRFDDGDGSGTVRFFANRGLTLGVRIEPLNADLGRYFGRDEGLLVLGVTEGTPAEEAGVKPGDVLLSLDGEALDDVDELRELLAEHEDGDEVNLEILRERDRRQLTVTLEEGEGWAGLSGEAPGTLQWLERMPRGDAHFFHHERPRAPRVLRRELDRSDELKELREELDQLREEVEKLRGN